MNTGFDRLAAALTAHARRLARARARAAERRAGAAQRGASWRSARLLWPDFAAED